MTVKAGSDFFNAQLPWMHTTSISYGSVNGKHYGGKQLQLVNKEIFSPSHDTLRFHGNPPAQA